MNREQADKLYDENWCGEDLTIAQVLQRIQKLAEAGAYQTHVQFDSSGSLRWIVKELIERGFTVENYNGTSDTIEISWG